MKKIVYALFLMLISNAPVYGKNTSFTTASAINARNTTHQFLLSAKNAYEIYNLEKLENALSSAHQSAPQRLDVLFSLGNTYILQGDIHKALDVYARINIQTGGDIDALTYLVMYKHYLGQPFTNEMSALKKISEQRAKDVATIIGNINEQLAMPIAEKLPAGYNKNNPALIITLGYALKEDGTMDSILIDRLEKTLAMAKMLPEAKIVVTGGVPKHDKSEGIEMKQWLIHQGIDENRIIAENYATDTVENFIYSRYIIKQEKRNNIVIVSSATHVRRCHVILQSLALAKGEHYDITTVAAPDASEEEMKFEGKRKLGIYRDALRAYGLYMISAAPEFSLN
ncbi:MULTISPECIES: YdcF family protein [Serratia]|uniref:YdcF family protein n=1 Tax=Serratia TaxID=613 RepID=UPI0007450EF6|nr:MULTISPECIES: YdcF family protein [Serratia]EJD6707729.1 YdcF family protein [Serratia marcescens]ELH4209780.1 YdcF family protein [Serratia marcescens]MBH3288160.1 YdcF family protein [Serratia marcescens]MCK1087561.1 YdcF family protein [Serratia marcescens]MDU2604085.1 YdcF family protein [Serratia marcescens]